MVLPTKIDLLNDDHPVGEEKHLESKLQKVDVTVLVLTDKRTRQKKMTELPHAHVPYNGTSLHKPVLRPLPPRKESLEVPNSALPVKIQNPGVPVEPASKVLQVAISNCKEQKSKESEYTGLDVEPNGMEFEDGSNIVPPPQVRPSHGRRQSRVRRSAVIMDDKGANLEFGLGLQGGESIHEARKKEIARSRWVKAIWYASEEAHRQRAAQKKALKLLNTQHKNERRSSGAGLKVSNGGKGPMMTKLSSLDNSGRGTDSGVAQGIDSSTGETSAERRERFYDTGRNLARRCQMLTWTLPVLVSVSLFYLLFIVDWCVIVTEKTSSSQDAVMYVLMAICFSIFVSDFVVSFRENRSRRWGFHMWLEVIIVLSSIPDLIFIAIAVNSTSVGNVSALMYVVRLWRSLELCFSFGARVSRTFRVIHLFNQWRKAARKLIRDNSVHTEIGFDSTGEDREASINPIPSGKTSIGLVLENTVSQHHLLIVGVLLVTSWASDSLNRYDRISQANSDLQFLASTYSFCNISDECRNEFPASLSRKISSNGQKLLYLRLDGFEIFGNESAKDEYRRYPYPEVIIAGKDLVGSLSFISVIHILDREPVVRECWGRTLEASLLIISYFFITTSLATMINTQIITPLRRIVRTVLALEVDPLRPLHRKAGKAFANKDVYEVTLIENALHKIAALMQLGFGEAGTFCLENLEC